MTLKVFGTNTGISLAGRKLGTTMDTMPRMVPTSKSIPSMLGRLQKSWPDLGMVTDCDVGDLSLIEKRLAKSSHSRVKNLYVESY